MGVPYTPKRATLAYLFNQNSREPHPPPNLPSRGEEKEVEGEIFVTARARLYNAIAAIGMIVTVLLPASNPSSSAL